MSVITVKTKAQKVSGISDYFMVIKTMSLFQLTGVSKSLIIVLLLLLNLENH